MAAAATSICRYYNFSRLWFTSEETEMMPWGDIPQELKRMSPEDRRVFDGWLKANVTLGALLTTGLIVMAVIGSKSVGPRDTLEAQIAIDDKKAGLAPRHVRLPHKVTPAVH